MPDRYAKGDIINRRYRVRDRLGFGGMGAVLLVEPVRGRGRFA